MPEEPPSCKSSLETAKRLYQQGNLKASANCFRELLIPKETRPEAYYGLGLIEFSQKNYVEALDLFKTAIQVGYSHPNVHFYIGSIREEQGNLEAAQSSYLKALSSNPSHRGALKATARVSSLASKRSFPVINSDVNSKSEFYELLSNDKSLAAQRSLALIDELEFSIIPPTRSFVSMIIIRTIRLVLAIAFFSFFLFIFLTIFLSRLRDPFSGPPPDALALRTLAPIIAVLIALGIYVSIYLGLQSAKNTKYEFSQGLLKITKGSLNIRTESVEVYRIKAISVAQDWFLRKIGRATLVLTIDNSTQVQLLGIAEASNAYYLQGRLRELSVSLRSLHWIKGIIS